MSDLYENKAIREHAEQLVSREVHACASTMIYNLAQAPDSCKAVGVDYEDELMPLISSDDWETPGRDWIDSADADAIADACEFMESDGAKVSDDINATRASLVEAVEASDDWAKFCDYVGEEPHQIEAYEHWIVSDWFARKLSERGEMVGEVYGFNIWGRPTTGQSIAMDSVILRIAEACLKA